MTKKYLISLHIAFWIIFFLVGSFIDTVGNHGGIFSFEFWFGDVFCMYFVSWFLRSIIIFYIAYWYFDCYFSIRNLIIHFFAFIFLSTLGVLFRYFVDEVIIAPFTNSWNIEKNTSLGIYFGKDFNTQMLIVLCAFLLKCIKDFFKSEAIKKEKITMELAYLKSQINPHFLFNTMNNLYGLSLSEPEKTPDVILKISEMMRYMLYESNEERVPLTKEIEYLNSYIELEKIRYEGQTFVDFTVEGNTNNKLIAPLLLISFVENIFKHGNIQDIDNQVVISLKVDENQLNFKQKNTIAIHEKDKMGGLGLKNVERRLFLLYHDKYKLNVKNENGIYESELTLKLL
jgi:two-component system, LytTR family, sensor kinase